MTPADRATIASMVAVAALGVGAILTSPARSHDAPMGWKYHIQCCSDRDCRQDDQAASVVDAGWLVHQTGEVIPWNDRRLKNSPDGLTHICMARADFTSPDARVLCLYVPPMGF